MSTQRTMSGRVAWTVLAVALLTAVNVQEAEKGPRDFDGLALGAAVNMRYSDLSAKTKSEDFGLNSNRCSLESGGAQSLAHHDPSTGTGSRSNPDLKALTADSYDLSPERYFNKGGYLSVGVFDTERRGATWRRET